MICSKCLKNFPESEIHESHDIPCYLFYNEIGRREKRNRADKLGRHLLCKSCHNDYELKLNEQLLFIAKEFAYFYFKDKQNEK